MRGSLRAWPAADFVDRRRWPPMGMLVLVVASCWLGGQLWRSWMAARELDQVDLLISAALKSSRPRAPIRADAPDRSRLDQLGAMERYWATPWPQWFEFLDARASSQTMIKRIQMDAQGTVQATSRSTSAEAMVDFMAKLQTDPRMSRVWLIRQETLRSEPGAPTQFEWGATAAGHNDSLKTVPTPSGTGPSGGRATP